MNETKTKESSKDIEIVFTISDSYMHYICVPIKSILDNHEQNNFHIHILTDSISQSSRQILKDNFGAALDDIIRIHSVDGKPLNGLKLGGYTKFAWYRILLPSIFPNLSKILYIDADTVINHNLENLFNIDLTNYSIGSIPDINAFDESHYLRSDIDTSKKYICTGILLMNLDYWRKNDITNKIIKWGLENNSKLKYPDQDCMNHVCHDSLLELPLKYGVSNYILTSKKFHDEYPQQVIDATKEQYVIHYNFLYPWIKECNHPYLDVWIKYNNKLNRKVKRFYRTNGFNKFKAWIYDTFFSTRSRDQIAKEKMIEMVKETENKLQNRHGID